MQLPNSNELEIRYLSRIFDNTSECYKYFWFKAIILKVLEDKITITYNELINEMIAEAWYMVTEYHLNLGPSDNLELVVRKLKEISGMKSSETKNIIVNYLNSCNDREIMRIKQILIKNVPYRLQAPFMDFLKGKDWNVGTSKLIDTINESDN